MGAPATEDIEEIKVEKQPEVAPVTSEPKTETPKTEGNN